MIYAPEFPVGSAKKTMLKHLSSCLSSLRKWGRSSVELQRDQGRPTSGEQQGLPLRWLYVWARVIRSWLFSCFSSSETSCEPCSSSCMKQNQEQLPSHILIQERKTGKSMFFNIFFSSCFLTPSERASFILIPSVEFSTGGTQTEAIETLTLSH